MEQRVSSAHGGPSQIIFGDADGTPNSVGWTLNSPRNLEETWAAFSDTDRFTRVGRLGHRVEERLQDDGQIMRVGRMRGLGLNLEWYERVFDYTHLVGFRVERGFLNGPARGYVLDVNLQAQGEGTEVHYRVRGFARYWWLWPVTWLVFHLRVRRSL